MMHAMKFGINRLVMMLLIVLTMMGCQNDPSWTAGDENQILQIMQEQEDCWNNGDLVCFMQGYWQSDSLQFVGKSGITYGWQPTLERYQQSYPDKATMGKLEFEILSIQRISADAAYVLGKWDLERDSNSVGGHYSLLWRKLDGKWTIVADHSS